MLWRVVIDKERFRSDQVVVMERNEDPVTISTPKSMLVSSLGGSCTVLKGKRDGKAGNQQKVLLPASCVFGHGLWSLLFDFHHGRAARSRALHPKTRKVSFV